MPTDGSGGQARRIQQHRIEEFGRLPGGRIGRDDLGMKFQPLIAWQLVLCTLFAFTCATLSFALVAVFVRFFKRPGPILDSLSRNAYGIYLLHYAFATWLQFALLRAPLTGVEKGGIVFAAALILSWATTALLRSFPTIARVI